MKISALVLPAVSGLLVFGSIGGTPLPAKADTASTMAIVAGAAAIVGALVYDSNGHPYYVRNSRRYYVTQDEATYYRSHHQGYERRAYVPEREYPVARDPYHNHY
jgi:hypothetical protein